MTFKVSSNHNSALLMTDITHSTQAQVGNGRERERRECLSVGLKMAAVIQVTNQEAPISSAGPIPPVLYYLHTL